MKRSLKSPALMNMKSGAKSLTILSTRMYQTAQYSGSDMTFYIIFTNINEVVNHFVITSDPQNGMFTFLPAPSPSPVLSKSPSVLWNGYSFLGSYLPKLLVEQSCIYVTTECCQCLSWITGGLKCREHCHSCSRCSASRRRGGNRSLWLPHFLPCPYTAASGQKYAFTQR